MELIRGLSQLRGRHRGCVATIGNFDGVHRGHQQIFEQLKIQAKQLNLPTVAICFEPQPKEFFAPDHAPARLSRLREKVSLIREQGIDRVLCLHFNDSFRALSAHDFIEQILIQSLDVKHLMVGDDFRFGQQRLGDFAMLCQYGQDHHFSVSHLPSYLLNDQRVSSSRVRDALAQRQLNEAARLLGRPYCIMGRVTHGLALGRKLGFPTLNIRLHRICSPLQGVVVVKVKGIGDRYLAGIANLGHRPVLKDQQTECLLEVHLLDFNADVYGTYVQVDFVHYLREERDFSDLDSLIEQMKLDEIEAQAYLDSE